jgi:hypothetical protein
MWMDRLAAMETFVRVALAGFDALLEGRIS